jgi:hypothetical protein
MTNKEVFESGKILQFYTTDFNPVTGEPGINAGIDNLVLFNGRVYSILTDKTGSVGDSYGLPLLISDNPQKFMEDLCFSENDLYQKHNWESDTEHFDIGDLIEWDELDRMDKLGWVRNDDW